FDWNWFRPALERYVSEKSGRDVRADDLHVSIGLTLEPTVRLRGVRIPNAPWASLRTPMAVAGEAQFTFSLSSLWGRRPVVTRLVLHDADVDLERAADGRRNWRLTEPYYRGPPRINVLTLEAHRSKIRYSNREIDLLVETAASPVHPETAA